MRDVGGFGKSAGQLSIGLSKNLGFEPLLQKRLYEGLWLSGHPYWRHHHSCLLVFFSLKCAWGPCAFLKPCHCVCSVRTNGDWLWSSCAWRKLILTAAEADSCTHKVRGSHPGCFLIVEVEKKETEEECCLRAPAETNWGPKEDTNKNEGGNRRLRPRAGQIQDSVAAGWSLRQGARAGGCTKKIRSVKSEWIQQDPVEALPCESYVPSAPPRTATPVLDKLRDPSMTGQIMLGHALSSQAPRSFPVFKHFSPNFVHWRDTGSQPPKASKSTTTGENMKRYKKSS